MPKMKTKKAAAKRFTMTASGKLKHGVAGKRHRLISHNSKYIRNNRGTEVVSEADAPRIVKKFLPYGAK
jgi:large subunit ribosomal protein L35